MAFKLYTYAKCSTCRDAAKWLREHGINFSEHAIRETPPHLDELRAMLAIYKGEVRRLFNSSGMDYRAQGLAQTLPRLNIDAALALLTENGNLVKRPFLLGDEPAVGLVGFKKEQWAATLLK